LDPGENVNIIIDCSNTGHCTSDNVTGLLLTTNSYISINSSDFELGTLEPGENSSAEFNITVDEGAPIGTSVDLAFELIAGEYFAQHTFYLTVGIIDEDFETADFLSYDWTLSGNMPWEISETSPYEGQYCAQSGNISHSQTSIMAITMEVLSDDSISFFRKVSSEVNYDWLRFYIDNTKVGEWSGDEDWERVIFPVTAGNHTFTWEYYKDGNTSNGMDCAWIDYVVFPPVSLSVSVNEVIGEMQLSVYPNPSRGISNIKYLISNTKYVTLTVYDIHGNEVRTLVNESQVAGEYSVWFDGAALPAGIYVYKIQAGDNVGTGKIVLIK